MAESSQERTPERTSTRAPAGCPVTLQYDDAGAKVEGLCVNVSIGGMFVQAEKPCRPGGLIRFDLRIDEETLVRGLGESIWQEAGGGGAEGQAGIGIKFRFLEPDGRQQILKLVSHFIRQRLAVRHPEFVLEAPAGDAAERGAEFRSLEASSEGRGVPADPMPPLVSRRRKLALHRADSPWRDLDIEPQQEKSEVPVVGVSQEPQHAKTHPLEPDLPPDHLPTQGEAQKHEWEATWEDSGEPAGETPEAAGASIISEVVYDEVVNYDEAVNRDQEEPPLSEPWQPQSEHQPTHPGRRASRRVGRGISPRLWLLLILGCGLLIWLAWGLLRGGKKDAAASQPGNGQAEVASEASPASENPADRGVEAGTLTATGSSDAAAPFGKILNLSWRPAKAKGRLVIQTDGRVIAGSYRHFRLEEGQTREVVRLRGVREPYRGELPVSGKLLRGIRTGLHRRAGAQELDIVLDLQDRRLKILRLEARDDTLIVDLGYP